MFTNILNKFDNAIEAFNAPSKEEMNFVGATQPLSDEISAFISANYDTAEKFVSSSYDVAEKFVGECIDDVADGLETVSNLRIVDKRDCPTKKK